MLELLGSGDISMREHGASICKTMASQPAGQEAIVKNVVVLSNLSKGLNDRLVATRLKVAEALLALACGFDG